MNVNFSGEVSAQAAAGETVTITITMPDGSEDTQTATTQADGTFATAVKSYAIGGTYNFVASIPADAAYKAASVNGSFTVLADRTLTVNVNSA